MDNPTFADGENIPLVNQDEEDYDDYRTPDTSRVETSFIEPDTTEATSTLRLRQKLKRDKMVSLYRYLADLDRFTIRKNLKTGNIELLFLDGNKHWQSLTNKRTSAFLAPKILREKFGGLNIMKNFLGIDETPSALERSVKAATRLGRELPTDLEMESIPGSPPKETGWLDRLADALKRLTGKSAEALSAIIGSVVGAALGFLGKTVGLAAKHIWALIVFIAGFIFCDDGKTYLPRPMP